MTEFKEKLPENRVFFTLLPSLSLSLSLSYTPTHSHTHPHRVAVIHMWMIKENSMKRNLSVSGQIHNYGNLFVLFAEVIHVDCFLNKYCLN